MPGLGKISLKNMLSLTLRTKFKIDQLKSNEQCDQMAIIILSKFGNIEQLKTATTITYLLKQVHNFAKY